MDVRAVLPQIDPRRVLLVDGEAPAIVSAARKHDADIPIVYISGFAGDAADALDRGSRTAYLPKPFRPDQLARAIAKAIDNTPQSAGKAG